MSTSEDETALFGYLAVDMAVDPGDVLAYPDKAWGTSTGTGTHTLCRSASTSDGATGAQNKKGLRGEGQQVS